LKKETEIKKSLELVSLYKKEKFLQNFDDWSNTPWPEFTDQGLPPNIPHEEA
jgi:hypothetical protein